MRQLQRTGNFNTNICFILPTRTRTGFYSDIFSRKSEQINCKKIHMHSLHAPASHTYTHVNILVPRKDRTRTRTERIKKLEKKHINTFPLSLSLFIFADLSYETVF